MVNVGFMVAGRSRVGTWYTESRGERKDNEEIGAWRVFFLSKFPRSCFVSGPSGDIGKIRDLHYSFEVRMGWGF
jgi:hypothetical protein